MQHLRADICFSLDFLAQYAQAVAREIAWHTAVERRISRHAKLHPQTAQQAERACALVGHEFEAHAHSAHDGELLTNQFGELLALVTGHSFGALERG